MISIKISELPAVEALQDDDVFPVVQEGSNKKVSKSKIVSGLVKAVNESFTGIHVLTQVEYDAIVTPDASTLYFIKPS